MLNGQQPGSSIEHPTHGYSSIPPAVMVIDANWGSEHDPVNSLPPVKVATAVVVAKGNWDSTVLVRVVEEVGILSTASAVSDLMRDDELLHPRKWGRVTLTLVQRTVLKFAAAIIGHSKIRESDNNADTHT